MNSVIKMNNMVKDYKMGDMMVHALRGVDLTIKQGEFVAIMGPSGSGKSTLMNLIGCLDKPTSGDFWLDREEVASLTKDQYADIRNQKIGFVFQGFNLLARTTALENVELPLLYDRTNRIKDPKLAAMAALERVGLGDRMDHEPSQLSGGQQQRVAIARALVNSPALILADEPTGNLDSKTSIEVMAVFQELNRQGITIILVTHEADIALYAKRNVVLRDGHIIQDEEIKQQSEARSILANWVDEE